MTINEYYDKFIKLCFPPEGKATVDERRRLATLVNEIRNRFKQPTPEESDWLRDHLQDQQARNFVALLLEIIETIEEKFFLPLVKAGVYEIDLSFNRQFIEPAVKLFGHRRVKEALLEFINSGTPFEQAGAINALYWTGMKLKFPPNVPDFGIRVRDARIPCGLRVACRYSAADSPSIA